LATVPLANKETDVYAGVALPSDAVLLAQFPAPGKIGWNQGGRRPLVIPPDDPLSQVEVLLPENIRPLHTNNYSLKVIGIDVLGNETFRDDRIISLAPGDDRFRTSFVSVKAATACKRCD
jgi:hypothetical protein